LFASDASGGSRRIGAQKFQAARLGAAEALNFQHDTVGGIFFYAQDAAGEIALVRREVHARIFAFNAALEMQSGSFGEPCSVFAHFQAAGRREIAKRAIQGRPVVPRRIQLHTVMETLCRFGEAACGYCSIRPVTRMEGYS
jgi:hypothetical protein